MEKLSNRELLYLYMDGYRSVDREKLYKMERVAIESIVNVSSKYNKICLGYSMGKDSIVVADLLKKSKIRYTPVLWQTRYQLPMTQKWFNENKPENCILIQIERPNWDDLENNEDLLFVGTPEANNIYMKYKWESQKKFLWRNGYDLFITGRRLAESNNCGSKKNNYIRRGSKYDVFSPIAEWGIKEVIAYIRYNELELPPQYLKTPNGFSFGSVAWTERRRYGEFPATMEQRFNEIYGVDKQVIVDAAKHLTAAKRFLDSKVN